MTDEEQASPDDGLFVTDTELARRLGLPRNIVRDAVTTLDANPQSGFPKKLPFWGNRRYWPAVRDYFDRWNGLPHAIGKGS